MTSPSIWCLIPLKRLESVKQRLSGVLDADERAGLVRAMATDVIRAARATAGLTGVAVVTVDSSLGEFARDEGAIVFAEPVESGLNNALTSGTARLVDLGAHAVIVLPGDVPHVLPEDIAALVEGHGISPAMTIARADTDGGTNALVLTAPHAIPFSFGENSFRLHCSSAHARGIEPRIKNLPRLARDIDGPADLMASLRAPSRTLTYLFLSNLASDEEAFKLRCSNET